MNRIYGGSLLMQFLLLPLETLKSSQHIQQFRYFPGRWAADEIRV
jgi:hypothetical protein